MGTDKFHISIKCQSLSDNTLQRVVNQCVSVGFTTTEDGRTDVIDEYESGRYTDDQVTGGYSPQTVIDEITEDSVGGITFWYGKYPITMECILKTDVALGIPNFIFEVDRYVFDTDYGSITPANYIDAFLNLTKNLVAALDVTFAKGECGLEVSLPSKRPILDNLESLPWLTVFSKKMVEELGGYERVLNTPAWRVEKLASSHVLLVRGDNPFYPTETPAISPKTYLFEGRESK